MSTAEASEERLVAILTLARAAGLGPRRRAALLRRFSSPQAALQALPRLAAAPGRFAGVRIPAAGPIRRELAELAGIGGRMTVGGDSAWPPLLDEIADAPAALALLGQPRLLARPAVAVVGARNASAGGRRFTETLARDLARAGYAVVSGLARGIDAAAHRGALAGGALAGDAPEGGTAAGGTIAVVAGGIDHVYPPENAALRDDIARRGLIVSDQPLGTVPRPGHFPRRNRILAGLALGVVVVEATLRSGALITARLAAENGRRVFAVPGSPRDQRARGPNQLIRAGAVLVESGADVIAGLETLAARPPLAADSPVFALAPAPGTDDSAGPEPLAPPPGAEERAAAGDGGRGGAEGEADDARQRLASALGSEAVEVDELVRRCRIAPAALQTLLIEMELAGRIERHPGNKVALV